MRVDEWVGRLSVAFMKPNDVAELAGGVAGSLGVALLLVLAIAAIVMPLYVIALYGEVKRQRRVMEMQLDELRLMRSRSTPTPGVPDWLPPQELLGPPKVRMRSNGI